CRLLGLGPGLTPSGDDLLGGALIALRFLQLDQLWAELWAIIASQMDARTHPISRAHLRAAAEGHCAPSLTAFLRAVTTRNIANLLDAIQGVTKLGHTSGWDILAGMVVVLRSFSRKIQAT